MKFTPDIWCICIALIFIEINATPLKKNSGGEDANQNILSEYEKQLEDEDVRELKNLKSSDGISLSASKTQKVIGTNVNGRKEQHAEISEQLNKNGELMERVQQKIDSKQESESVPPRAQVFTEIEVAPKSNHKWLQDNVQIRDNYQKKMAPVKQKQWSAENAAANNLLDQFKMKAVVKYLPVEMADYIYQTGDERTVTMAIENYLRFGIMDRDEAIAYLQEIKTILNTIKENDLRDKKQEQQRRYIEMYENSHNNRVDMNQALSDLKDIQQLIQNKFLKRAYSQDNFENQNTRYRYNKDEVEAPENYIDDGVQLRFLEKDYKNLAEKLQNFESLFSESSMEGVIYELAKVLFYQSFSMNGQEAQESLKQFTSFLEAQVDEGHISPNIERKVLDILLAALTDTLNEHPELMYGKSVMEQFPKQPPLGTGPSVPSGFKTVEKKSGTGNKNRHDKMNLEVSGILDDDKH